MLRALGDPCPRVRASLQSLPLGNELTKSRNLSARAFGVFWVLHDDEAVKSAGVDAMTLAKDIEQWLDRFPHAQANPDEQRRLRAAIYKPLLGLLPEERARAVGLVLKLLLAEADT